MKRKGDDWIPCEGFKLERTNGGKVRLVVRNPSDRALRYRANRNAPDVTPCLWCGARKSPGGRPLEVAHINGLEDDNDPANLGWTCRPCNVKTGRTLAAAAIGRKTVQFNPGSVQGQWTHAVMVTRGDIPASKRELVEAVEVLRSTPLDRRGRLAAALTNRGRLMLPRSNPKREGAKNLDQWRAFVSMMRSYDQAESDEGYSLVMATDPALRSRFNKQLWKYRRRRAGEVPF